MAVLGINDSPTLTDTIQFNLLTPGADGCFSANPYTIDNVTIYFVERDFISGNTSEYDDTIYDDSKSAAAQAAQVLACSNPTAENIATAQAAQAEANSTGILVPMYFNQAVAVLAIGTIPANPGSLPAWDSNDPENSLLVNVPLDANGNPQYGVFTFDWTPTGMREGDYFICWTWTPLVAGNSLSANQRFILEGSTEITTVIPTHFTDPTKYPTLLDRYLPEMFKTQISSNDLTPDVLSRFNLAVAQGFVVLENLSNQIIDLLDANATAFAFLPLLSNFFGWKLKSDDPTLWRRQIKQAIPLYKQKGTLPGLAGALAATGMSLLKLTRLWQVVSSYTWQESFVVGDSNDFELTQVALPLDTNNFALSIRYLGEATYNPLTPDYVEFTTVNGITTMSWAGDTLSISPISLVTGDILLVTYLYAPIPGPQQSLENYLRTLPLADQRDETAQDYPKKNWNVRVIEEDDPLFDQIVPTRHPYHDFLVYGQVRTEFAFSENIYNMEEYNGSIRNSKLPCDIDKNFMDECNYCQSSKFNVDIAIESLSDDRILEAQDVIQEFSPFHAILHTMNFVGTVTEFIQPPVEDIEILILFKGSEFLISGGAQMLFNRVLLDGTSSGAIMRDMLANATLVANDSGVAFNNNITIFSPDVRFDDIGIAHNGTTILEIFSPSSNAGVYTVSNPGVNTALVSSATEPLNTSAFTFRLSNHMLTGSLCNIFQDNVNNLYDNQNFGELGVISQGDVNKAALWQESFPTTPWSVSIPAYSSSPYVILLVAPDGSLVLDDPNNTLPSNNITNVSYLLINDASTTVLTSSSGSLVVTLRGRTQVLDSNLFDVRDSTKRGWYQSIFDPQFEIIGYVDGAQDQFYLGGYNLGGKNGISLEVYQRLVDNKVGYLGHQGMMLNTSTNYEATEQINNGENPPSPDNTFENDCFKEDFLITIGDEVFYIIDINGTAITLGGPDNYWRTLANGGTPVDFCLYHYTKESFMVDGQEFDFIDRRGKEIINISETVAASVTLTSLRKPKLPAGGGFSEIVQQQESISITIHQKDGTSQKVDL